MQSYKSLNNINQIIDNYDAFIIDIWGVLWDGIKAYKYAKLTLKKLKEKNKNIILLSNAPRRAKIVSDKLSSIGINNNLYDNIVSSGEVCREECLSNKKKLSLLGENYYFIGQELDKGIATNLEIKEVSSISKSSFILVCGTRDFDHTLNNYKKELNEALKYNLPLVCANPDKVVIRQNGQLITCAGILADYYHNNGGEVFRYGKPFQAMYEKSFNILKSFNTRLALDKVLVIGDSLETDILGANNNKLNSLLITNGIHKHELTNSNNYEVYKNSIDKLCKKYSAFPNYIIKDFIF